MNPTQARQLIQTTFPAAFDKARFRAFAINVLNHVDEGKAFARNSIYVKGAFRAHVQRFERLGTYTSPGKEKVDILIVYLTAESKLARARTAIRNFVADHLKEREEKDAALVAFVSPTEKQWRLEEAAGHVGHFGRVYDAKQFFRNPAAVKQEFKDAVATLFKP